MTSRERVRRVLRRKKADRVPIDFGGFNVTGINAFAYIELGNYIGLDLEYPKIIDPLMMLARVEDSIRSRVRSDTIPLENISERWGLTHNNWIEWHRGKYPVLMPGKSSFAYNSNGSISLLDPGGVKVAEMPQDGLYFDPISYSALSNEFVLADPEKCKKSIPLYRQEDLVTMEKHARLLYEYTDCAITGGFRKGQLGHNWAFAGHSLTDWLCLLHLEPNYTTEMLQMVTERALENLEMYIDAVGRYIDVIFISSTDFGTQRNSMIHPDIFHERYRPCYKQMNTYVHEHCEAKTFFHSCGSVRLLIDDLVDSGVDILNPIQASANGMDVSGLKRDFGDNIIFWGGGIDSQDTLQFGSTSDVSRQVIERIHVLGHGGGYVFAADHNIQYGVPPENIITMFDTAAQNGKY